MAKHSLATSRGASEFAFAAISLRSQCTGFKRCFTGCLSRGAPHGVASNKVRQGTFDVLKAGFGALVKVKLLPPWAPPSYCVVAFSLGGCNTEHETIQVVAEKMQTHEIGVSETGSAKMGSAIDVRIDDAGSMLKFRIGFPLWFSAVVSQLRLGLVVGFGAIQAVDTDFPYRVLSSTG